MVRKYQQVQDLIQASETIVGSQAEYDKLTNLDAEEVVATEEVVAETVTSLEE